ARRAGVPLVFRALDVSHRIRESPVSGLIRRAEKHIYGAATMLSVHNEAMAEYCRDLSGRRGPVSINLPPLDLSHFAQEPSGDLRGRLGIGDDERVILYMGSFFRFSGLDLFLDAIAPRLLADPRLRVVLLGGGELDDDLRQRADRLGIADRVIFTGVIAYAELPLYLKLADVAINPFHRELLTDVALPHKVLQYMAAGVPVVSTSLRGLRSTLGEESGVTWGDSPTDVADRAAALAITGAAALAAISQRQKTTVGSLFSTDAAVDSFESMLESVV
ncbi:MAG: glycosyltransferase, partial [Rhodococcus fascians]